MQFELNAPNIIFCSDHLGLTLHDRALIAVEDWKRNARFDAGYVIARLIQMGDFDRHDTSAEGVPVLSESSAKARF